MSSESLGTWENALKAAGTSDARQVRQVMDYANLITYDRFPFLAMLGGVAYEKVSGTEVSKKNVSGKIMSKAVSGLNPELYDFEVAPNEFRVTTDTLSVDVGDSVTLLLATTNGIDVNAVLSKVDQGIQMRVVSIDSATAVTVVITSFDTGPGIITKDDNIAYVEKLGVSETDAVQVGNGTNQEPINRSNFLQFMIKPTSQGILQKSLQLYSSEGNEYEQEKQRKMVDMQRDREMQMLFGRKTETGTGASRILTADGLLGMSGSVFANTGVDGELTFDDFSRGLMPALRQGGGSMEVYAVAGSDVLTTLSSYSEVNIRTKSGDDKYAANIQTLETPSGILHLIPHAAMDTAARKGQMIAFQPEFLSRCYLKNLDLQMIENLNLGNELADRSAIAVAEGLLASNPKAITTVTNVLK